MKALIFDTETTGFPLWTKPSHHPGQPHLVQLTALLVDTETEEELEYCDMIIRPDGWKIKPELAALHGITQERAMDEGVPERDAALAYHRMVCLAGGVVCYGVAFDTRIMRIALLRCGFSRENIASLEGTLQTFCVQSKCTPFAKIPPTEKMLQANRRHYKTPNLAEALKVLLGEDMQDAHDSRGDVLATMKLFYWLTKVAPTLPVAELV